MRTIIVVLAILAVLSAVLIHQLNERLFGLPVPDGFNPNSTFSFRVVGFAMNFGRDWCALGYRWGLIDNYHISLRNTLAFFASLAMRKAFSDQLEMNNTEIFGTRVRIYRPVNKTKDKEETKDKENVKKVLLPAVIYYHGGGWTIGSLDAYDAYCRRLAVTAQVVVVSTDYRQAPEHLYPTAFHDCYNVAVGLLNTGAQYGVDVKKILVAGDSAGGNLAAAVAHYLAYVGEKHCKKQYLAGQILIYPSLQFLNLSLPSHIRNKEAVVLSRRHTAEFISLYLTGNLKLVDAILEGNHSKHLENTTFMSYVQPSRDENGSEEETSGEEDSPEVTQKPFIEMSDLAAEALTHFKGSPLVASNFRGIPSTFMITAEHDPLMDEGFLYAKRLKNAGIDIVHKHYNSFHGFATTTCEPWPYGTWESAEALRDVVAYIRMRVKETEPEVDKDIDSEEHEDS